MAKRRAEDFFTDLELICAAGFFEDLDEIIRNEQREADRKRRYQIKREINAVKAHRIHKRLIRVMAFDPWKHTKHIKPDVFGDQYERYEAVKALENKRLRIKWVLWCMYHWWMFDVLAPGAKRYGKKYSLHRKLWYLHRDNHQEQLRQERWDRKREQVRARREKRERKRHYKKRNADETLAELKRTRVQKVIDELEDASLWKEIP